MPGALSHLDLLWEDPETAGFFHRLATLGRLIPFDKRDTGLSDRAPADSPLEERMDDVRAVMHAAGSGEAVLFGYLEGAPMSILFTATYPELVSSLILGAATARYRRAPDYPCGRGSDEMFDSSRRSPRTGGDKAQPSTGSFPAARAHHRRGRCSRALSGWPTAPVRFCGSSGWSARSTSARCCQRFTCRRS